MIHIITGKINDSKTTKLLDIFYSMENGDGFVALKKMKNDLVYGYVALHLSTGDQYPLTIREDFKDEEFVSCCQVGPYLFYKPTIDLIEEKIRGMIQKRVSPIFLDEIGILELNNQCFANIFQEMVDSKLDLYVTIRRSLVEEIIERYQITEYHLIESKEVK